MQWQSTQAIIRDVLTPEAGAESGRRVLRYAGKRMAFFEQPGVNNAGNDPLCCMIPFY